MNTPTDEGREAAMEGKLYCENPYPETMEAHWQWLAGWAEQKERQMPEPPRMANHRSPFGMFG